MSASASTLNKILVGVGELGVSQDVNSEIVTMALGSCVAIIVHDKITRAYGMVHIACPDSRKGGATGKATAYFADQGIPLLFKAMERLGSKPDGRGLEIKLAGGASIIGNLGRFGIGRRNIMAVRRILWHHGLGAAVEDLGGNNSRTVHLIVHSGACIISSPDLPDTRL